MLAAANSQALWYLTRATGLVSLLLLTGSVALGVMGAQRWASTRWPRFVTGGLHKNMSLLAVAFLAVHIVTAVTDSFVTIRWLNVFVPFSGTYRPLWLGLGAVASDLLLAVILTSVARQWVGYRAWRAVHWAAYACWPVALVHGLGTGSDARRGWALAVFLGCLAVVCGAVWWRLSAAGAGVDARKGPAVTASVAVPVVIVAWLVAGPLQPGWAAKAGTPAAAVASAPSSPAPAASLSSPFTATVTGIASQSQTDSRGDATVTLSATLSGPVSGKLKVTLTGPVLAGGGVELTASQATLGPADQPSLYAGQVTALSGDRLTLRLGATASPIYASLRLSIDGAGNFTGTVRTSATPPA